MVNPEMSNSGRPRTSSHDELVAPEGQAGGKDSDKCLLSVPSGQVPFQRLCSTLVTRADWGQKTQVEDGTSPCGELEWSLVVHCRILFPYGKTEAQKLA